MMHAYVDVTKYIHIYLFVADDEKNNIESREILVYVPMVEPRV